MWTLRTRRWQKICAFSVYYLEALFKIIIIVINKLHYPA